MRIDGHQHFWSLARCDYGWLTPDVTSLYRDFLPEDLQPLLRASGIDRTVLVQAAATTAETRYLLELAEQHVFVAGVVGWVDMDSPADALQALDLFAQQPKFVGVRPMIQDIENIAWIDRPELGTVLDALSERGLCFDALVRSTHLPYLSSCLARHPTLRVVIDHGAKPNIAAGEWQPWAGGIARIASETDAYCKVSGLITEAGDSQDYQDITHYLDFLLDTFGPSRLIWGSDWPVLNLAGDYCGWHRASLKWLSRLSNQDQDNILGANAMRFYSLSQACRTQGS